MKKYLIAVVLTIFGALPGFADGAVGIWKTQVDDGSYAYVDMTICEGKICGVISRTFDDSGEYQSENLGKPIVWDMVANGNGKYSSGKIWQPSTGKVFSSKMVLNGDILKVSGCVAAGLICKKQTWTRVQ